MNQNKNQSPRDVKKKGGVVMNNFLLYYICFSVVILILSNSMVKKIGAYSSFLLQIFILSAIFVSGKFFINERTMIKICLGSLIFCILMVVSQYKKVVLPSEIRNTYGYSLIILISQIYITGFINLIMIIINLWNRKYSSYKIKSRFSPAFCCLIS